MNEVCVTEQGHAGEEWATDLPGPHGQQPPGSNQQSQRTCVCVMLTVLQSRPQMVECQCESSPDVPVWVHCPGASLRVVPNFAGTFRLLDQGVVLGTVIRKSGFAREETQVEERHSGTP